MGMQLGKVFIEMVAMDVGELRGRKIPSYDRPVHTLLPRGMDKEQEPQGNYYNVCRKVGGDFGAPEKGA